MKKALSIITCFALLTNVATLPSRANEQGGNVTTRAAVNDISIGNSYIRRTFDLTDGKLKTKSIENKRIGETFQPAEGSEDFIINLVNKKAEEKPSIQLPTQQLDRTHWEGTVKNKDGNSIGDANVLFDGNKNTYVDNYTVSGFPINVDIKLGDEAQKVSSFAFQKRPGYTDEAYGKNGTLGKFKLYVSEDGIDWKDAGEGEFTEKDYNLHKNGELYNVGDPVYANFNQTYETKYVRIQMLSDALGATEEFSGAEINLFSDFVNKGLPTKELKLQEGSAKLNDVVENKLIDGNLQMAAKGEGDNKIVLDLGTSQPIGSFAYQKRPGYHQDGWGVNGTMGEYELFVSEDGNDWTPAGSGAFEKDDYGLHSVVLDKDTETSDGNYQAGTTLYNVGNLVYGNFNEGTTGRYVKIVPKTDCFGGADEFQVSEIKLFTDRKFEPEVVDTDIRSSELTVQEKNISKTDNEIRVSYDTYEKDGIKWDIDLVTVMEDGKHYMNSYLEVTSSDPENAKIDYIDMDHFKISEDTKGVWSIPEESTISSMWIGKHELMLGQPIYADGLFFGSEFPAQETDINKNNEMQIRYYSGKSIKKMQEDNQNVLEDGKTFRTWNNVVGAAQGTETDVVQTDFFNYIEDIATPSEFRKQYNSWYDNMMNISADSIETSFLGAEKGLAENGIEPLDSYVVDDGWNNYNNEIGGVYAPGASGTTMNETGFWEFNSKFPNELYTSTELTDKLQSTFGVWVGPQGGYNYFGGFAKYLESMGTGEMQTNSALGNVICTGSRTYLKNFEDRFIDYQTRFNIDYWKWDGFASRPCNNADHNHMTGGNNNMYFTSDMWEAWTDVFEHARTARGDKGLWINATCYINLSPWLLQWVNTVWVQDSGDTGEDGDKTAARHQRKIYYRDNVYYNLYKNNQIQFPLKNIYNHDPIYGVSDGSEATTDVFREFLFDNAMRGTAFWELYYSPSMIDDEKWQVTADALDFAETYHDVLKNAKLFVEEGTRPTNGVYGYSAWNNDLGFVSFVNPTNTEKKFTLQLTDVYGVPQGMKDLQQRSIYPYAAEPTGEVFDYGDTVEVTLPAFSSQIYQFGNTDTKAPELVSAKVTGENTAEVRFNERVNDQMKFTVNGKEVTAKLLEDYRTWSLTTDEALGDTAKLNVTSISDIYGNKTADLTTEIRSTGDVASLTTKEQATRNITSSTLDNGKEAFDFNKNTVVLSENGIEGKTDFTLSTAVATESSNATILEQDGAYKLYIDKEGYAVFEVNGEKVSTKETVTTVTERAHGTFGTDEYVESTTKDTVIGKVNDGKMHTIQAVRELNGMLKIYLDGKLSASYYNEATKNADLKTASVVAGSEAFVGQLSDVHVGNEAVYYDDAEEIAETFGIDATERVLSKEGWSAEACSSANSGSDGNIDKAIDGDLNTYWHSSYFTENPDTCDGTHTVTVDFGKELTFDNLVYVARNNGTNGNWTSATVYGVKEDGTETKIAEVPEITLTDNQYRFVFDKSQTFKKVRFEVTGVGGYASAAEISATENVKNVGEAVKELKNKAQEMYDAVDESLYTETSYQAFEDAVNDVLAMPYYVNSKELSEKETNLQTAYDNLEEVKAPTIVNKKALQDLVDEYKALKEEEYTKESWKTFEDAYDHAVEVLNSETATQEEVNKAVAELTNAKEKLERVITVQPGEDDEDTPKDEPTDEPNSDSKDESKDDSSVGTGDTTQNGIFASMTLLSGMALAYFFIRRKKEEQAEIK